IAVLADQVQHVEQAQDQDSQREQRGHRDLDPQGAAEVLEVLLERVGGDAQPDLTLVVWARLQGHVDDFLVQGRPVPRKGAQNVRPYLVPHTFAQDVDDPDPEAVAKLHVPDEADSVHVRLDQPPEPRQVTEQLAVVDPVPVHADLGDLRRDLLRGVPSQIDPLPQHLEAQVAKGELPADPQEGHDHHEEDEEGPEGLAPNRFGENITKASCPGTHRGDSTRSGVGYSRSWTCEVLRCGKNSAQGDRWEWIALDSGLTWK